MIKRNILDFEYLEVSKIFEIVLLIYKYCNYLIYKRIHEDRENLIASTAIFVHIKIEN